MDWSTLGFPVLHYLPVCSASCPLSRWCYPTISSSAILFFCLQSFPASGSFPMSRLFVSDGQSIGVSASTSVLPKITQGWFPLGSTGLISLLSKVLSRVFFSITVWKHQFFRALSRLYMTARKIIALTIWTFVGKEMSMLFNMLSRFVIAFLWILWLQVTVCSDFGAQEN